MSTKAEKKPDKLSIKIDAMEFEDLLPIFKLGEKLFTAEKWPNLYRTWDEYELLERFMTDHEFCLTAKYKKQIVGFAIGTIIEKRRSSWTYGYLIWIGVDPKFLAQGIGKKLLRKMTKIFIKHGARILIADTDSENSNAIKFLQKNGFKPENDQIYFAKNLSKHPTYLRLQKKKNED
jgi:ribosomal protein S18 acetylase RimI-like enzyme